MEEEEEKLALVRAVGAKSNDCTRDRQRTTPTRANRRQLSILQADTWFFIFVLGSRFRAVRKLSLQLHLAGASSLANAWPLHLFWGPGALRRYTSTDLPPVTTHHVPEALKCTETPRSVPRAGLTTQCEVSVGTLPILMALPSSSTSTSRPLLLAAARAPSGSASASSVHTFMSDALDIVTTRRSSGETAKSQISARCPTTVSIQRCCSRSQTLSRCPLTRTRA